MVVQRMAGMDIDIAGSGPAVVMIHGLGGGADNFEPLMPALQGYRTIRINLPGSDTSPTAFQTLSIESFTQSVVDLLRAMDLAEAHFVGHSLGTLVCQCFAIRQPDRVTSLTLFGPLTEPSPEARSALRDRANLARKEGMTGIAQAIVERTLSKQTRETNPAAVSEVRKSLSRQDPEGYARSCEALSAAHALDWRAIRARCLLITGDEDPVAPPAMAQVLNQHLSSSTVTILTECGHWPMIERAQDCSNHLLTFLTNGQPTSRPAGGSNIGTSKRREDNAMAQPGTIPAWQDVGSDSTLFKNVRILDATGEPPYPGQVLVQGNRIKTIERTMTSSYGMPGGSMPSTENGKNVVDGQGATLMPGMIDGHLHLTWNNAPGIDPIQMMETEEHMLVTMEMAKLVLDAGFTSGRGAASAKPRLDVVCRNFIDQGRFPGPRYKAAGPEITTVGGLGDSAPSHIPHEGLNLGWVVSGPEEVRRAVRILIKYGVDSIKLNLSGEAITGMAAEETPMSEEEIEMAVREARRRGKVLSAHARSSGSVKQCVQYGIENIYHASFADEEALTMLERAKDKHFVAPGIAWLINTAYHAEEYGIKPGSPVAQEYERELQMCEETMKKMHARGIRICIGGDYGFAWTPQGTNARDVETFVDRLGFSPMAAIQAATKYGGEIMGMGDELGLIKEGYLADLLLVDGDPVADVRILQDSNRLLAIMKDGAFHKPPTRPRAGLQSGYIASAL